MNRPVRFLACVAAWALSACCAAPRPKLSELRDTDYPGVLRAPASFGVEGQWQQVVTAEWEGGKRSFDAILMQKDDLLRVLGPSPVGGVAFVFDLLGEETTFDNRTGERVPFPPRFILLDVQRAFFPWLDSPRPTDGGRSGIVDGERVAETWQGGRLLERRFARLDGQPAGEIVVRYEWDNPDWFVPTRVSLANDWFGYRLTVRTSSEQLLKGGCP